MISANGVWRNLGEVSEGGKKILISYNTGQFCLLWSELCPESAWHLSFPHSLEFESKALFSPSEP